MCTTEEGDAVFTDKPKVSERQVTSAAARLEALNSTAESWYDGSIGSIDKRLAQLNSLVTSYRSMAGEEYDSPHLETVSALEAEYAEMSAFREAAMGETVFDTRTPGRETTAALSDRGRKFVALELNQFLADNADAIHDAEEMGIRAAHYASDRVGLASPEEGHAIIHHFRAAAVAQVRPAAPTERVAHSTDFADSLIFV